MDFCRWISHESGYKCEICGFTTKLENAIRQCKAPPGIVQRIANFIPAFAGHIRVGSPKCTQGEIDYRLNICRECPLYVNHTCISQSCGCAISDKQVFLNKLYWADQKCPLDKWGKIVGSGV